MQKISLFNVNKSPANRLTTSIIDHVQPKNFQLPFYFYKFVPACKKSVNSIYYLWRYSQFLSPETRLATPIFDHAKPKNFQLPFSFCGFASTRKDLQCFIHLFWRNGWLRNLGFRIWLTKTIFAYISGTRFFPNIGFVQKHSI